jgi:hypothetical protein
MSDINSTAAGEQRRAESSAPTPAPEPTKFLVVAPYWNRSTREARVVAFFVSAFHSFEASWFAADSLRDDDRAVALLRAVLSEQEFSELFRPADLASRRPLHTAGLRFGEPYVTTAEELTVGLVTISSETKFELTLAASGPATK